MYKDGRWAREIINLQQPDGRWGFFHTLSEPNKMPMTTEQALRRLSILGYTIEDGCIAKAVEYMNDCLTGKNQIPDRREKLHDWDIFTDLMLSTWIRRFTKDNPAANAVAAKWAAVISAAFAGGEYNQAAYESAYMDILNTKKSKGGRLLDFVNFYQVSLVSDCLDEQTEAAAFDYILNHESGIYYIYGSRLSKTPETFASKNASRYLGAAELLTAYKRNKHKLQFIVNWLMYDMDTDGKWDMGASVKDHVYFPMSDDWRQASNRVNDCTCRIRKFIITITGPR